MSKTRIVYLGLALSSWIFCTGCLIPVPRKATIQPALHIQIVDENKRPIARQNVVLSWRSRPGRRRHDVQKKKTDKTGKVHWNQKKKWEWIMPLMIHGVPHHYWEICVARKGFASHIQTYEQPKSSNGKRLLVIQLKRGKAKRACNFTKDSVKK